LRLPGEATPDGVDMATLPPDFGDANYIAEPDAVFSSPRKTFDNVRRQNRQQSRTVGCPTVVLHARALQAQTPVGLLFGNREKQYLRSIRFDRARNESCRSADTPTLSSVNG